MSSNLAKKVKTPLKSKPSQKKESINPDAFPPGWNPNSFNSLEIKVTAQNLTTRMDFSEPESIKITEFLPEGLVLDVRKGNAAKGHHILIEANAILQNTDEVTPLHATGKVEEVHVPVDESDYVSITIHFLQFEPKEWSDFQSKFGSRQAEILEFFKAVKGEE